MRIEQLTSILAGFALTGPLAAQRIREVDVPVSAFVDSAAAVESLRAVPALPADAPRAERIFILFFGPDGAPDSIGWLGSATEDSAYATAVRAALRPHLAARTLDRQRAIVAVMVETGAQARLQLRDPLKESPPQLRNRTAVVNALAAAARTLTRNHQVQATSASVSVMVDISGTPQDPIIAQSSGLVAVDAEMLRVVGIMRFRPAMLERVPVPVRVTLPIAMTPSLPIQSRPADGSGPPFPP